MALSPRDFGAHFASFFDEAAQAGEVVAWGGVITDIGQDGGGPEVTAVQGRAAGLAVFIQTSPFRQEDGSSAGDLAADGDRWRQDLVDLVAAHDIAFLGVGVEVNFLRENDPAAYAALAQWYPSVYDAVTAAGPRTLVFPTFQYERMVGAHGGLWGGEGGQPTQWDTLADFPQRDLTAFTTYPFLVHEDIADVPEGYFDPIHQHATGPFAFTEIGWPAADPVAGWSADEAEQAAFVDWFFDHAPPSRLSVWLHVYDQDTAAPFQQVGLRAGDGSARPAWDRWVEHAA